MTEAVRKRQSRLNLDIDLITVDFKSYCHGLRSPQVIAFFNARSTMTPANALR
jgi:hypothetical protein